MSAASPEGAAPITEARARELIVEGLAAALPVAIKLIETHVEARLSNHPGQRPLFSDWGRRS